MSLGTHGVDSRSKHGGVNHLSVIEAFVGPTCDQKWVGEFNTALNSILVNHSLLAWCGKTPLRDAGQAFITLGKPMSRGMMSTNLET